MEDFKASSTHIDRAEEMREIPLEGKESQEIDPNNPQVEFSFSAR